MNTDGWTVEEAIGKAIAWGILNEVDSLEAHVEGDALIVNATKTLLSSVTKFVINQVGSTVEIKAL